jgi:hypothetical protein
MTSSRPYGGCGLVAESGGNQDSTGTQVCAAGQPYMEAGLDADHGVVDQAAAKAGHLSPACRQSSRGGMPSLERKPCMCAAGALRAPRH